MEQMETKALRKFAASFLVELWDIDKDIAFPIEVALKEMSDEEKRCLIQLLMKLDADKNVNFAEVWNSMRGDARVYGADNSRAFLAELLNGFKNFL